MAKVRNLLGPAGGPDASRTAYSVYELALRQLSPSKPETSEILALVLDRDPRLPGSSGKPADLVFTSTGTRTSVGGRRSAVEIAAHQWSPAGVRTLLDHGLTVPSEAVSGAIVSAAANGAEPIITMLLDAGADVNGRDRHGDTALAMARRVDNAGIAALLLARGAREP